MLKNSSVLITGGTGSLGKFLINFLLTNKKYLPKHIRILSRDEDKQYWMNDSYRNSKLEFIIGDVRCYSTVASAMQNIDIVIHAAAMKQVPICENHPYEAVQTNIIGTNNIITAIQHYKIPIKKVIGISTDKACNPINIYGMTKNIQEKLFIQANNNIKTTDFILTRYGNVLGSRGSVIPVFQEQIKRGGPITITDHNMTRFFFSLEDATLTILAAIYKGKRGEIFVPKIKSFSILNIAKAMNKNYNLEIKTVGIRHGEKIHEILISNDEIYRTYANTFIGKKYYVISPNIVKNSIDMATPYSSEFNINTLDETHSLLQEHYFI